MFRQLILLLVLHNVYTSMGMKSDFKPQAFRVKPKDIQAKEGDEILLHCEVDNVAGEVQWTKDGMALGYEREIPGYPTYSMIGSQGVYNLKIQNVSLGDDALFECQVGQTLLPVRQNRLRAQAKVNVSAPPSSLEMLDHVNNSKVVAQAGEELKLQCLARNSKPPAKVSWYKGRKELESDHDDIVQNCRKRNGTNVDVCDVLSTLTVKLESNDSVQISCVAKHEALTSKMSSTVQFIVHYPPDKPFIDGYTEGEELHNGQQLKLTCRASGGNPPAHLSWYRNQQLLPIHTNTHPGKGKLSESYAVIEVKPEDNNSNYSCKASNPATVSPLVTSVQLSVLFGPNEVKLTGSEEGKAGDVVSVTCTTSSSNPPAVVSWTVDGREHIKSVVSYVPGSNGGAITISTLDITVPPQKEEMKVVCYAANTGTSKNVVGSKTIQILYPPGQPIISGFTKAGYKLSDSKVTLTCTSSGGNPLATLTWYKNNKKFSGGTKTSDEASTSANITFLLNKDDNGAVYKCEAINSAIEVPFIASIPLNVYFPPDDLKIGVVTEDLHAGMQAKLLCNVSVSNPVAEISWWLNGLRQSDGITFSSKPGLYGGELAFSELILNVTADMNGNEVICKAESAIWPLSRTTNTFLNVKYKPRFLDTNHTSAILKTEGEFFTIAFQAVGNPTEVTYEWKKNGHLLSTQHGSTLVIRNLRRGDSGSYTCSATNSEGTSDLISFKLVVQYGAKIVNISRNVIASNGSDAVMACTVDGNPIESYHVFWIGPKMVELAERMITSFENNTSTLKVIGVTQEDVGLYYCIVNNTVGSAVNDTVRLILEHAPITKKRNVNKVASDSNETIRFTCEASGVPELFFNWSKKDAKEIFANDTKYSITKSKLDVLNYRSTLLIRNVSHSDYGTYICSVKNKLGESKVDFELLIKSIPFMPSDLKLINVTQSTVTLSWMLEFDGGEPSSFRVRYYPENDSSKFHEIDVGSVSLYTVTELYAGITYIFDVMAFNKKGHSSYSSSKINATTMPNGSKLIVELPVDGESLVMIISAGVGVLLICLNIFIVIVCLLKKFKKTNKGLSDSGSRKPSTIEMYGPASRNSNDINARVETVSSSLQSEKSVRFLMADDDRNKINEDQSDVPYIIEDINYPFIESNEYELHRRHSTKDLLSPKLYGNAYEGYSTISHGHQLKPMVPQFIPFNVDSVNYAQSTMPNVGKRKFPHVHHNDYYRDESPTPTIPPPMSKSLLSEHFLNL